MSDPAKIVVSIPHLPDRRVDYLSETTVHVAIQNTGASPITVQRIELRFQSDVRRADPKTTVIDVCDLRVDPSRMAYQNIRVTPNLMFLPFTNQFEVVVTYFETAATTPGSHTAPILPYLVIEYPPTMFGEVFISYKEPEDRAIAEKLYEIARRAGFAPYMAPADVNPGSKLWEEKIPRAIAASRFFFYIWTAQTGSGTGVERELGICRINEIEEVLLLQNGVDRPACYDARIEYSRFDPGDPLPVFATVLKKKREAV